MVKGKHLIMPRYLASVLKAKTATFRSHIPLTPSGALLLTGLRGSGRFISNQRGYINYGTMPFIVKYSPLEIFQK